MTAIFTWSLLHERIDSLLDRIVFGRPDYRRTLSVITAGIAKTADADSATGYVTRELAAALRAEWVRFGESRDPEAQAAAAVVGPAKRWGILSLGPRRRGQAYQSQDVTFIDGVAAQLSAALEGLDARAERQLASQAEVRALRAQINPHFLFNSLNSLADMVKDSSRTEETVLNLARVFRYALESTRNASVPLDEELRFVASYLNIEQVRFEDRLRFNIDCSHALRGKCVPPMLIQPLVENAINHGLAPKVEGGFINIVVRQVDASALRITVEDTGVGFDPAKAGGGVGVENVRRRVQAMPEGRFEIVSRPGEGARITLEWKNA
jgi:two-component system LytT family sensor kinase